MAFFTLWSNLTLILEGTRAVINSTVSVIFNLFVIFYPKRKQYKNLTDKSHT